MNACFLLFVLGLAATYVAPSAADLAELEGKIQELQSKIDNLVAGIIPGGKSILIFHFTFYYYQVTKENGRYFTILYISNNNIK